MVNIEKAERGDLRATGNGTVWRVEEYRWTWKWWKGWREWKPIKVSLFSPIAGMCSPDVEYRADSMDEAEKKIAEILLDRAKQGRQFYPELTPLEISDPIHNLIICPYAKKTVPDMPGPLPPPPNEKLTPEEARSIIRELDHSSRIGCDPDFCACSWHTLLRKLHRIAKC